MLATLLDTPACRFACLLLALLALFSAVMPQRVDAQPQPEHYRAFWVDTFNTPLNNHTDVVTLVSNVKAANANAIFAQVRRRGDSWYLNSLEPPADREPLAPGFDPLADLIAEAHAHGIEVHAFVIVGALWNRDPQLFPPVAANHPFNLHGFNQATGSIYEGPNNWLTRTLLPDQNASDGSRLISYSGYRFGSEFWIDPGHPDAAAYTVDVLMHLVRNYQIDGLHLDRIRYPEISISGQSPASGTSVGYNETNVRRFQQRYGISASSPHPAANDERWSQWRRDQVTNLVRRIYLNALLIRWNLKVSAALIAFGGGPTSEQSWTSAEAFWRVYQDWRAWTEEGILDIAIPMNYKTEHTAAGRTGFDQWNEWTKNHAYNRATMIGQGAFVNSIEGTLRQTRRALAPSAAGNNTSGVIFFSMATTNVAVNANPFSIPPGQNTPRRPFPEFASGLTTGRSVDRNQAYEDAATNPVPVFSSSARPPIFPWKTNPRVGHLMGTIRNERGEAIDTGDVVISRVEDGTSPSAGRTSVSTATDGGGFYGGVDLAPGTYRLKVTPIGQPAYTPPTTVEVIAGQVSRLDVTINPSASATLQFGATNYRVAEGEGSAEITLTRTGDASSEATVEYSTIDDAASVRCDTVNGIAYARCDYSTTIDTLRFAPGETAKSFRIPIIDDAHADGTETLQLRLENPTGAVLGSARTATLTITDNDTGGSANPINSAGFFVRMHYLDFLSREPEAEGFNAWTGVLNRCPNVNDDPACDRVTVSSSFFRSEEFQIKGYFVYLFYKVSLGRLPRYAEIIPDMRRVTGQTADDLVRKKDAFTDEWTRRAEFRRLYDGLSNDAFVDTLLRTAGVQLGSRNQLVTDLNSNQRTRAQVLRAVIESSEVMTKEYNGAFVAMQYFGYLRRDPDEEGFQGWLRYLNANPADFRTMVHGFVNSVEYRLRFGQP